MKEKKPAKKTEKSKGFQVPAAARAMANSIGLDVDAIVRGAAENKARLENLEKAIVEIASHIEDSDKKLAPLVNAIEQAEAARKQAPVTASSNPAPQGVQGLGSLLQFLPQLLGGGGVDEEMRSLNKRMMEMSLNRMQADIGFTEAIKNAIVTKLAGKAAADLAI